MTDLEIPNDSYITIECVRDDAIRSYKLIAVLCNEIDEWCAEMLSGDYTLLAQSSPIGARYLLRFAELNDAVLFKLRWL